MSMATKQAEGSPGSKRQEAQGQGATQKGKCKLGIIFNELGKVKGWESNLQHWEGECLPLGPVKGGFIMACFLPRLYVFIRYSIILSAGTTSSARTLHHFLLSCHLQKDLMEPWPIPPSKFRARPPQIWACPTAVLMDTQMFSCGSQYQTLGSS